MLYSASTLTLPIHGFLRLTKEVSQRSPWKLPRICPKGHPGVAHRLSRGPPEVVQRSPSSQGCSKGPEVPEGQRLPRCCPEYRHLSSNNDLAKKSFSKCCVIISEKMHHLQWQGIRGTFLNNWLTNWLKIFIQKENFCYLNEKYCNFDKNCSLMHFKVNHF